MKPSPRKEAQKTFCYTHYLDPASELHPEFVRFDFNAGTRNFRYGPHRHAEHELIYVQAGCYRAWLNEEKLELHPGDMLLVCPGDLHSDEARLGLSYYSLTFTVRQAGSAPGLPLLRRNLSAPEKVLYDSGGKILALIVSASEEMSGGELGSPQLAHIILHELFWKLVRLIPSRLQASEFYRAGDANDFAARFYRVLAENEESKMELKDLSRRLGMSVAQLAKLCALRLGNSPARLLQEFRIERAAELLAKSDLGIREIAERLAFSDQFCFSRTFRRLKGLSPRAYRLNAISDFQEKGC